MRSILLTVGLAATSMLVAAAICRADEAPKPAADAPLASNGARPGQRPRFAERPTLRPPIESSGFSRSSSSPSRWIWPALREPIACSSPSAMERSIRFPTTRASNGPICFSISAKSSTGWPFIRSFPRTATSTSRTSSIPRTSCPTARTSPGFKSARDNPLRCDPATEQLLLDLAFRAVTTAAACSSAPTATCTSPPATPARSPTRTKPARTSRTCPARSCASTSIAATRTKRTPFPPTIRSSASRVRGPRSGPTGCGSPGR